MTVFKGWEASVVKGCLLASKEDVLPRIEHLKKGHRRMTNSTADINAKGFAGNMRDAPEEWRKNTAPITKCESEQRLRLAFSSEQSDRIFFKVRIRGDKEDLSLEVQCLAWAYREKVRFVTITGMVTRNNQSVPYWAEIDTLRREGKLYMSEEYFAKIGFAPERMSAF